MPHLLQRRSSIGGDRLDRCRGVRDRTLESSFGVLTRGTSEQQVVVITLLRVQYVIYKQRAQCFASNEPDGRRTEGKVLVNHIWYEQGCHLYN